MTAQPALRHRFTPEEYFDWEVDQELRHEYYHGEVFAMSGGTANHALIAMNVGGELRTAFRGSPCRVFSSDLRVQFAEGTHYAYPDVTVVCGEAEFLCERQTTLLNPTLVVEVLSPSTADYDRGFKFAAYRGIASLQEVLFVAHDRRALELFRRGDDGHWTLYDPEDGRLSLATGGAVLTVDAVYEGTDPAAFQVKPPPAE